MTGSTGSPGSGKSKVVTTLFTAPARELYDSRRLPASHLIKGIEQIAKAVRIDHQVPPAADAPFESGNLYRVFTAIATSRNAAGAAERGYKPSRFPSLSRAAAARPDRVKASAASR